MNGLQQKLVLLIIIWEIFFDSDGKWAVGDKENRIAITLVLSDKSEFSPDSIDVPLKDFKDRFFTSREAAEQALKEREENA